MIKSENILEYEDDIERCVLWQHRTISCLKLQLSRRRQLVATLRQHSALTVHISNPHLKTYTID